jgi:hypothetical protein
MVEGPSRDPGGTAYAAAMARLGAERVASVTAGARAPGPP